MSKLFKLLLPGLFIAGIWACKSKPQPTSLAVSQDFFADSLYKFTNFKGVLSTDSFNLYENDMVQADSVFKKTYINPIRFFETSSFSNLYPLYSCAYFSKQPRVGDIQPVIVAISMDDYSSFMLLLFNEQRELTGYKEIAGGTATGPDETELGITLPIESYSNILSNTRLDFIQVERTLPFVDSLPSDSLQIIDSFVTRIEIQKPGVVKILSSDSFHLTPQTKKDD